MPSNPVGGQPGRAIARASSPLSSFPSLQGQRGSYTRRYRPPADDELSFGSFPLPRRSPSPRRPSWSISVARHRMRRQPSKDRQSPMPAQQYVPDPTVGLPRPVPAIYLLFGVAPEPQMVFAPAVRGPQDMLSTPLGQHILDYDPPRWLLHSADPAYR